MYLIDIGACTGLFIEHYRSTVSSDLTVDAFEPLPANAAALRKTYANQPNVVIHESAVAGHNGNAKLYLKRDQRKLFNFLPRARYNYAGNAGSSLAANKSNVSNLIFTTVRTTKLSTFLTDQPNRYVDVLKIDAEGSEYDILRDVLDNDLHKRIGKIYFEDHCRKIPTLTPARNAIVQNIYQLGIQDQFMLQNPAEDDLAYLPLAKVWTKSDTSVLAV